MAGKLKVQILQAYICTLFDYDMSYRHVSRGMGLEECFDICFAPHIEDHSSILGVHYNLRNIKPAAILFIYCTRDKTAIDNAMQYNL